MDELNDDVLLIIMNHLKYCDWENFCLTCKRINNLATYYDKYKRIKEYLQHVLQMRNNWKEKYDQGNPKVWWIQCYRCRQTNTKGTEFYVRCRFCQRIYCEECSNKVTDPDSISCWCEQIVCYDCHESLGASIPKLFWWTFDNPWCNYCFDEYKVEVKFRDGEYYCHKCEHKLEKNQEDDSEYLAYVVDDTNDNGIFCLECYQKTYPGRCL